MEKSLMQIEELDKDNYDTWKMQSEVILTQTGYCSVNNRLEEDDQKAKAYIILSMQPSELCIMKHGTTSIPERVQETMMGPLYPKSTLKKNKFGFMDK